MSVNRKVTVPTGSGGVAGAGSADVIGLRKRIGAQEVRWSAGRDPVQSWSDVSLRPECLRWAFSRAGLEAIVIFPTGRAVRFMVSRVRIMSIGVSINDTSGAIHGG